MTNQIPAKAHQIIEAVQANPSLTARQLATAHSCSKQYVHLVLNGIGLKPAEPVRVWSPAEPRTVDPKHVIPGNQTKVSTAVSGSISELMVATDLMARGWKIFFPLFRAHSDLIAQSSDGTVLKRFEVRGARRKDGQIVFSRKPEDQCDHYAAVIAGEPIRYFPPL